MSFITETSYIPHTGTHRETEKRSTGSCLPLSYVQNVEFPDGQDNIMPYSASTSYGEKAGTSSIRSDPLISERAVDEPRPLKVIYIGAGASGIIAGIQFRKAVPHLDLIIYEKNAELGGTWYENKYPGCACDVPSHSYQLSFESWTGWSQFFSGADEILQYWKRVAEKYNLREHIRFNRQCIGARWNESTGKWFVQMQNVETGDTFEDSSDVLMTGTGQLNQWKWPSISGLHTFEGSLLHSANWDESFDARDKKVAVVGAGSSGIQIVPALVDKVRGMDHYIRGKTWISSQNSRSRVNARTNGQGGNFAYTEEEKQAWRRDPESYIRYRKQLEFDMQTLYAKSQRGSRLQEDARVQFTADMEQRLKGKPNLLDLLLPDFPPLCKRLTPGPGYLEALTSPKVNVIATAIAQVDKKGIITVDGVHHPVDAIVCATGFETDPSGGFPIRGRNGVNLRERYARRPETYLGMCTDGFPNFFQSLGPHQFQGAGNLLIMMEQVHRYVGQILARMAYGNIGLVEPRPTHVENFTRFTEAYFERTVYSAECASWYKSSPPAASWEERKRGRVTALWPGSSLHAVRTLQQVRWEDFTITPYDGNAFGWFGNGWTLGEKSHAVNDDAVSWYLNHTGFVDEIPLRDGK
ncbi:hypothetical protein BDV59DRAFT_200232 [Aspergillus ambiguus]|uniref:flavin-containing monooxygenase n=1 Tax=Aspergillus ambiguus TaxID=176160 RepID=UPI003CCD7D5A